MSGIYIHIPFCYKRCIYCDFFLVTNLELIENFLSSLKKEISLTSKNYKDEKFDSIYFGGGTPSILSIEQITSIIMEVKQNFNVSDDAEVTLEANPENLKGADLKALREAGVNRLSIGVQSFSDSELNFLTRNHTGEEAVSILNEVNKVFDNYSVDIIYSLPEQKENNVLSSIKLLDDLNVPHVSAYALTYEEKTPLYKMLQRGEIGKNTDEADLFKFVSDKMIETGYEHYEISSFARPGHEAVHNSKYWKYENYLGLGPSAHSFFNNKRWNNVKNIKEYTLVLNNEKLPRENEIELTKDEMKFEFIMTGLRSGGVDQNKFYELFGEEFMSIHKVSIENLINSGFAKVSGNKFKLTQKGFLLADEITAKYF